MRVSFLLLLLTMILKRSATRPIHSSRCDDGVWQMVVEIAMGVGDRDVDDNNKRVRIQMRECVKK